MDSNARKHYIDNLRWITLLILIPYHAAMAWNVWDEPNYIFFEGSKSLSSIIVFFSPYFMPLLFVLAGISAKFSLQKRTCGEYLIERVKKLLIPFLFGTVALMPIMSYIGDRFNCSYQGSFFRHYAVFFTRYTDLTGADGGFSVGQFWFLLYLFVISILSIAVITLFKRVTFKSKKTIPFWSVLVLGLPLPLLSECLSIGGKSLAEYAYLFMIGYFVFSDDETVGKAEKNFRLLSAVGITAAILNVYLFIWTDKEYIPLNTVTKYLSEWFMIIALIALGKRYLNFNGNISDHFKKRSFLFYIWHFIWVVLFQYMLYKNIGEHTVILFAGTVLLSYLMTFICCEITLRIPFLCFLTGAKYLPKDGR